MAAIRVKKAARIDTILHRCEESDRIDEIYCG